MMLLTTDCGFPARLLAGAARVVLRFAGIFCFFAVGEEFLGLDARAVVIPGVSQPEGSRFVYRGETSLVGFFEVVTILETTSTGGGGIAWAESVLADSFQGVSQKSGIQSPYHTTSRLYTCEHVL